MTWSLGRLPRQLFLVAAVSVFVISFAPRALRAEEVDLWSHSTTVPIVLTSYQFAPAQVALEHGKSYRLRLVNSSGKGHDFSAPGLFASSTIAPADRSEVSDGAVEVDSGSSADVLLIPMTPGNYAVKCTHFLHATFGMRGNVTVN